MTHYWRIGAEANRGFPYEGLWPLPILPDGRYPKVSDGFSTIRGKHSDGSPLIHGGVDIMYPRNDDEDDSPPQGSKRHFMPDGIPVYAVADGNIRAARWTRRGYTVLIRHTNPFRTYYTHMLQYEDSPLTVGDDIEKGTIIGIVHGDPTQGAKALWHLHLESWRNDSSNRFDLQPYMKKWTFQRLEALA